MSISKPVIYVSSTIYDFQDLRSALKFWLEQLGYEVMLSDFNDFTKPLEENSYEACLRAIERADYFILLIGSRVGGFYDTAQKVSITRMEYRKAYKLVQQGRIKLATFVRQDLWNIKEDRSALKDFLLHDYKARKELETEDINETFRHPSTFVNDVEATFAFLRDVAKVEEMKLAINGKASFPVANWVHQFSTFQDITEVLNRLFNMKRGLNEVAMTLNLKRELISILQELASKRENGTIYLQTHWADLARGQLTGGFKDSTKMPKKHVSWLVMYVLTKSSVDRLPTQFIDQALRSGEYLQYDLGANTFAFSLVHNGLLLLQDNIQYLKRLNNQYAHEQIEAFILKYSPRGNPHMKSAGNIVISNQELMLPFAFYDAEKNIADLCIALLKALDGDSTRLRSVPLRPANPIQPMAEELESETATTDELAHWIRSL